MLVSKICTTILSLIIIGLTLTDVKEEISGNDCKRHIKRTAGCMNQVLSNQTLTDRKQWKCKRHLPVIEVCRPMINAHGTCVARIYFGNYQTLLCSSVRHYVCAFLRNEIKL